MDEVVNGAPKITVVAKKKIKEGEELLLNYGSDYFEDLTCLCGHETKCLEIEKKKRKMEEDRKDEEDE